MKEEGCGNAKNNTTYVYHQKQIKARKKPITTTNLYLIQTEKYNKQGKLISNITNQKNGEKKRHNPFCGMTVHHVIKQPKVRGFSKEMY
ncbi:MAG: hypothetical protein IPH89_12235 [Bacteroidetes bacterium]|nr:hypothetical protein [Bacteroidota bacterium]